MYSLGISYGYHDSSAALVRNGEVLCAALEERFTRQKHDSNFPNYSIQYCLESAGIDISEVEVIAYHEDPQEKFSRVVCSSLSSFPHSRREFVNSMKSWLGKKIWTVHQISRKLDVAPSRIKTLNHHLSHASNAFLGSGFEEAAILVVDAVGEWASTAFYRGCWQHGQAHIEKIQHVNFPHSLGLVYSAVTAHLGFNPNDGECSTMALAAFGVPAYLDDFREIISYKPGGTYSVDQSYFNFCNFYQGACSEKFIRKFGPPRDHQELLPFSCLEENFGMENLSEDQKRYANLACSIQAIYEEVIVKMAKDLQRAFPSPNLCLAGGSALNCVANSKILPATDFSKLFIPLDPGDGGSSIGAALYVNQVKASHQYGAYLGKEYAVNKEQEMIEHIRPQRFKKFLKHRNRASGIEHWQKETLSDPSELAREVAKELYAGKVVGWFQGKFEWGPRALGNRSLLVRPDDYQLARKLSTQIKERASFRPYSLSMTPEAAKLILAMPEEDYPGHRWMQKAAKIRPEVFGKVKAGVHVDSTTRPQVTFPEDNPLYHRLLEAYGALSGLEALLNTSFNEKGSPIVASPTMALLMFARTEIDVLVMNNLLIRKVYS